MRKQLKAIPLLLLAIGAVITSCSKYNDDEIWAKVNELLQRVQQLETSSAQMNSNINTLHFLLEGIDENIYILSIDELSGEEGYSINLSNGNTLKVYHGKDAPAIGITQQIDGDYYWTLDEQIIKDENGNPIRANGTEAPAPQVKTGNELINSGVTGSWEQDAMYLSVNQGKSWTKISASGGTPLFTSVDVSSESEVVFVLSGGSSFTVARTDKSLELLYGRWKGRDYWSDVIYYTFNRDNTYIYEEDGDHYTGKYKYFPSRYMFIIYYPWEDEEEDHNIFTIVEITDEMLLLNDNGKSQVMTFYRQ